MYEAESEACSQATMVTHMGYQWSVGAGLHGNSKNAMATPR